jgi:predicted MPP superfamily phosphohydrolase
MPSLPSDFPPRKPLVWVSDFHLTFFDQEALFAIFKRIMLTHPSMLLLSGDISDGKHLADHLLAVVPAVNCPVYFVLGNHDYYLSSFGAIESTISCIAKNEPRLFWLETAGVVPLSDETGLIGHGGWADGQAGVGLRSTVTLNDFIYIKDFQDLMRPALFEELNRRGKACAEFLNQTLPQALERFHQVIVLMHVPPFEAAARYKGKPSSPEYAPHFSCIQAGQTILKISQQYPDRKIRIYCGHTHESYEMQAAPNVYVTVSGSDYKKPDIRLIQDY